MTSIRHYDSERNATDTCFVNTSDLLSESENTAPEAQYILALKLILNNLSSDLPHFQAFCSNDASAMTGKKGGVAAKFRKD